MIPRTINNKRRHEAQNPCARRLEELRDREIVAAFPTSPPDEGLLRPSLLEEFLDKRPTTRDEWFRKIPQHLRTTVDSKQVSQYLDRILQLIASS
jgi:hypothetical protein